MRKISTTARDVVKRGRLMTGTVVSAYANRATVRLSGDGTVLHNLLVSGGPVYPGNSVSVDFTTPEPTVFATGRTWVTYEQLMYELSKIKMGGTKAGFTWMILKFDGGYVSGTYTPDGAGFADAIEEAGDGTTILIPPGEIVCDPQTLPLGACLAGVDNENSIVNCQITLSDRTKIAGLNVTHAANSASDMIGVIGPTGGVAHIHNSLIMGWNCGDGDGIGIQGSGGTVEISDSHVVGESISGTGTAINGTSGTIRLLNSTYYGSTNDFLGSDANTKIYAVTSGVSRIRCTGVVLPNCRNTYNWAIQLFSESFGLTQSIPESVTSMTPTKFLDNVLADDPLLSTNYVYIWTAEAICIRYRISDGGEDSAVDIGDNKYWNDSSYATSGWCLYNEDTGYACVVDDATYPNRTWSLIKLDFLTGLSTTLLSWAEREAISGGYRHNRPYLIRYNDTLLIIDVTTTQIGTDPLDGELRVRKFDIATEAVTFTSSYVAASPDPDNYHYKPFYFGPLGAHDQGVPHLLGDTLVYPIAIAYIFDDSGSTPPITYNASIPLLVFDIGAETIAMKFWLTTERDPDIFNTTGWDGTGHKTYLFLDYGVNESNDAGLLEYALDTDTFTLKQYWTGSPSKNIQFFQGKNGIKVVWLDMSPSPDVINIKDNPTDWNTVEQFNKPPYLLASYMGIWDDGGSNSCWLYEEDGTTAVILSGYNPTTDTTREITISGLTRVTSFDAFLGAGYFLLRTMGATSANSDWYIAR